jgi:hypothetical protein
MDMLDLTNFLKQNLVDGIPASDDSTELHAVVTNPRLFCTIEVLCWRQNVAFELKLRS